MLLLLLLLHVLTHLTSASLLLTLRGVDPAKFDPPLAMCILGCPSDTYMSVLLWQRSSDVEFDAAGSSSVFKLGPIQLARVPAHMFLDLHIAAVVCTSGMM
jgi:hypothetical protein